MIEGTVNNNINAITKTLFGSKDQILEAAKKRGKEEALKQIPTPEQFQIELNSYIQANSTPSQLEELENKYNRAIELVENAISKLERSKQPLESIKSKIGDIEAKLEFLNELNELMQPAVAMLNLIITGLNASLALQTGLAANGATITIAGDGIKKARDFLTRGSNIVGSIPSLISIYTSKVTELKDPLNQGIQSIDDAIFLLETLLDRFQSIWIGFLTETLDESTLANTPFEGFNFEEGTNSKPNSEGSSPYSSDVIFEAGPGTGNIDSDSLVFKKFKNI